MSKEPFLRSFTIQKIGSAIVYAPLALLHLKAIRCNNRHSLSKAAH
jgi:hypothetical protein